MATLSIYVHFYFLEVSVTEFMMSARGQKSEMQTFQAHWALYKSSEMLKIRYKRARFPEKRAQSPVSGFLWRENAIPYYFSRESKGNGSWREAFTFTHIKVLISLQTSLAPLILTSNQNLNKYTSEYKKPS